MIQTADGALTETHSILQRMRELAVQASSDTNTDDDRTQIQNEIDQLTQEVDRIATTTEFNTKKLLDGSRTGAVTEKAGKASVEGTFGNSNVSAEITTNGADKAAFTDVIRVEITKDFAAGQSTASSGKYSTAELDAAVAAMQGAAGYTVGDSLEKNIANAIDVLTPTLEGAKTDAATSADAVAANEAIIDKIVEQVKNADQAAIDEGGVSIFAAGKTAEDLKEVLQEAVNGYATNTKGAGGTAGTQTNIKAVIATVFNTAGAGTITAAKGGAAITFDKTLKDDGTQNNAVTTTAKTTSGDLAAEIAAKLDVLAIELGKTKYDNDANQDALATAQKNIDILSNTDLMTAKTEVDVANAELTSAKGGGDKSKIDIAQAQLDTAEAKLSELNAGNSVLTVTDLFGNGTDTSKFEIASNVADDGTLTINLKNKEGDDTVITINNADKLKAGDVITITAEKMVESKQAATGKEAFRLQVGANAGQEVALGINSMKAKDLEIVQTKEGVEGKALDVSSQATASLAVNAYDLAIQKVSTERAKMGAMQNRLEHTIANLDTSAENLQSAESSLRDTDMAEEMTNFSKNNILMQAGQSMLAQANQSNQGVLSLLQ